MAAPLGKKPTTLALRLISPFRRSRAGQGGPGGDDEMGVAGLLL